MLCLLTISKLPQSRLGRNILVICVVAGSGFSRAYVCGLQAMSYVRRGGVQGVPRTRVELRCPSQS